MTKQKIQMAFYLPVSVKEMIREIYIEKLREDNKTSQSDIVCEAITYWYECRDKAKKN